MGLSPRRAPGQSLSASVQIELCQLAQAETTLDGLLQTQPRWADGHALLGRARLMRGDAIGAEEPLRAVLGINPGFGAALADLGWAMLEQRRTSEADDAFAAALAQHPLDALPRQQLASRLLLATTRADEQTR